MFWRVCKERDKGMCRQAGDEKQGGKNETSVKAQVGEGAEGQRDGGVVGRVKEEGREKEKKTDG